jgi:endonuclease III
MSADPYSERFAKHASHDKLAEAARIAREALGQVAASDQASRMRAERIADGLELAIGRLAQVDARWTGAAAMTRLEQGVQELVNSLNGFLRDKNASALKAANIHLDDAVLPAVSALPASSDPNIVASSLGDVLSGFRELVQRELQDVRATTEGVGELARLRNNDLEALRKAIDEQVDRITKQNERLDSVVADFNKRSADLEQQRETRFAQFQREEVKKHTAELRERIAEFDTAVRKAKEQSAKTIESLGETRSKVAKIYGTIGNEALTGDYKRTANENERAANQLRRAAIFALGGMALLVGAVAFTVGQGEIGWDVAVFRLTAALALVAAAAYLARESGRHRAFAERMRRLELELASIDSFIVHLPDDQRSLLKAELARKYFANHSEPAMSEEMRFRDLLKEARAFIRAMRKGT